MTSTSGSALAAGTTYGLDGDVVVRLLVAALLGGLVGLEREASDIIDRLTGVEPAQLAVRRDDGHLVLSAAVAGRRESLRRWITELTASPHVASVHEE